MDLTLRFATEHDAATIHDLIVQLAVYEREPDAVECSANDLREQLASDRPPFECLLVEEGARACAFALFFMNYSTWRGRPGLYLEDLFVLPSHRKRGIGRALLSSLASLARSRGCKRMEWAVLDWNQPAIDFYEAMGAKAMNQWTIFRLDRKAFGSLADGARMRIADGS